MHRVFRSVLAILAFCSSTSPAAIPRALAQDRDLAVYVGVQKTNAASGEWVEPDSKDLKDSADDLSAALRDCWCDAVVERRKEDADIAIEIVKRFVDDDATVVAVIVAGEYRKEIKGVGTFWKGAANDLARQVEFFIKENRQRILALRDKE